jgi:hypothetical protein
MSRIPTITRERAVEKIYTLVHSIFGVTFTKRSTGEMRTMAARLHVKSHLKGGPPTYNPKDHNLIWVFDMRKVAYRSISIEGIVRVKIGGKEYRVRES